MKQGRQPLPIWLIAFAVVGLMGAATGAWLFFRGEPNHDGPDHVILIVIDTLRADVVDEVHTPVMDGLREQGSRVTRAWSSGTWTAPSVISLFSGMPVRTHGWDFPFPGQMNHRTNSYPQIPDVPLLAEVLKEEGFQTGAFYGNRLLGQGLGYERGFDYFIPSGDRTLPERLSERLSQQDLSKRQFIYLHMFGGHHPLRPTDESIERWGLDSDLIRKRGFSLLKAERGSTRVQEQYRLSYRAVVEDIDTRLGLVLDALEPIRDDALIIVTSDHGEMLGEHGHFGHRDWLYEPLTQVPFMAVGAGELPETLTLAAVPDLITQTLGIEHEWPVGIQDSGPLVSQRESKVALSSDGRMKAIWDDEAFASGVAVFDLVEDPLEETPIAGQEEVMEGIRTQWEETTPFNQLYAVDGPMSDETLNTLEALGYME